MPAFDVLTNPTSLPPLKPGEKKTIVVTATNRMTRAVTGRAVPFVEPKAFAAMVKPPAKAEQNFSQAGVTQEFPFSLEIPADAKAASFTVRIDVVDVDHQDDNFGQSPVLKVVIEAQVVKPPPPPPKKWWLWVLIGVGVVVLGIVVYLLIPKGNKMPKVVGLTFEKADPQLTAKKIRVVRVDTLNADTANFHGNVVIEQDPPAGTKLKPDSNSVRLVVQKPFTVVPRVRGLEAIPAAQRIGAASLQLGVAQQCRTTPSPDNGKVITVVPAETTLVAQNTTVTITVVSVQASCGRLGVGWDRALLEEARRARTSRQPRRPNQ